MDTLIKERPILFSGEMVRAIIQGRKTQTRRLVKPQPELLNYGTYQPVEYGLWFPSTPSGKIGLVPAIKCPYGQPGERLWVRETFYAYGYWDVRFNHQKQRYEWHFVDLTIRRGLDYHYSENPPEIVNRKRVPRINRWWKRASIHMPRDASRILLEVTDVRVERLNKISEADAMAEGIKADVYLGDIPTAIVHFAMLWQSINGPGSWEQNPWVWVVGIKRIEP